MTRRQRTSELFGTLFGLMKIKGILRDLALVRELAEGYSIGTRNNANAFKQAVQNMNAENPEGNRMMAQKLTTLAVMMEKVADALDVVEETAASAVQYSKDNFK